VVSEDFHRFLPKLKRFRGVRRASAFAFQTLETTKTLKNFYHKGASNQGSEANKDAGSSAFSLPFSPFSPLRWLFSSRII
jgi:hypothetical protein